MGNRRGGIGEPVPPVAAVGRDGGVIYRKLAKLFKII